MNLTFFRIAIFILCPLVFAGSGFARERDSYKHRATPAPTPQGQTITSVGGSTITVSDENSSKTVAVSSFTEITVNGQRATISDLKSGMKVSLGLSDPMHASRVTATTTK